MHVKTDFRENCKDKLIESPRPLYLNQQDKRKLMESLKSPGIADRLTTLITSDQDPQNMVSVISDTLLEACSKANIKAKKNYCTLIEDDPWFDKECKKIKNSIKIKCSLLRKDGTKTNLHSEILIGNKLLKSMIKKKKEGYKLKIVNDMNIKKKDQKAFWKLLGKLKNSKSDRVFQNNISGEKWKNYFTDILNDNTREIKYPPDCLDTGPLD